MIHPVLATPQCSVTAVRLANSTFRVRSPHKTVLTLGVSCKYVDSQDLSPFRLAGYKISGSLEHGNLYNLLEQVAELRKGCPHGFIYLY